jgi:carbon storage regulator
MLVLRRKVSERIVISDSIVITVVQVIGSSVKIGIEAPPQVTVLREELTHSPVGIPPRAMPSPRFGKPVSWRSRVSPLLGTPKKNNDPILS